MNKTITLRVTPELEAYIDTLHTQLSCSRQEAIRRCIIYCVGCPDKVNNYIFTRAKLLNCSKEVKNEKIQTFEEWKTSKTQRTL